MAKQKTVAIRLPEGRLERIDQLAEAAGMNRSQMLRFLIDEGYWSHLAKRMRQDRHG